VINSEMGYQTGDVVEIKFHWIEGSFRGVIEERIDCGYFIKMLSGNVRGKIMTVFLNEVVRKVD